MDANLAKLLDATGRRLVDLLQEDARLSYSELGRRVGLSATAVIERIRRLEEAGLITGYHAAIDASKLGVSLTAFVRLTTPPERYGAVRELALGETAVLECHHVTGEESFVLKVRVSSVAELEALIERLSRLGRTSTSIVMSSLVG